MKAVVLCAGKGTRIREITKGEKPKPMIEVKGKPLLGHTLEWLSGSDVDEVLINLHYQGEKIQEYFGSEYSGMRISYYWEEELLGTAGALTQMQEDLDEEFFVIYGDIISDLNLNELHQFQTSSNASGTIVVYTGEEDLTEASIISLDYENRIQDFIEKPSEQTISEVKEDIWTNAGIYCLDPEIIDHVQEADDFSKNVFPEVLESQECLKAFKLPEKAYWQEVGNPERYRKLQKDVKNKLIDW